VELVFRELAHEVVLFYPYWDYFARF
jgi:hypothetical protein